MTAYVSEESVPAEEQDKKNEIDGTSNGKEAKRKEKLRWFNTQFASFAHGLQNDYEAVKNAVIYPYSNGFVEGSNNRLKMIKRTMYGRANLPLLSVKVCGSH